MTQESELVEIRRYLGRLEADGDKAMLVACGIPAEVFVDNEGNMAPHLAIVTAARLMVPEQSRSEALALLTQSDRGEHRSVADASDASSADPITLNLNQTVHRIFLAAVFGALILPVLSQFYSLWMAIKIRPHWSQLSTRQQVKLSIAVVLDIATLVCAIVFWIWLNSPR